MSLFVQYIDSKSQQDLKHQKFRKSFVCFWLFLYFRHFISHPYITLAKYCLFIYFVWLFIESSGKFFSWNYKIILRHSVVLSEIELFVFSSYFSRQITSSFEKYIVYLYYLFPEFYEEKSLWCDSVGFYFTKKANSSTSSSLNNFIFIVM